MGGCRSINANLGKLINGKSACFRRPPISLCLRCETGSMLTPFYSQNKYGVSRNKYMLITFNVQTLHAYSQYTLVGQNMYWSRHAYRPRGCSDSLRTMLERRISDCIWLVVVSSLNILEAVALWVSVCKKKVEATSRAYQCMATRVSFFSNTNGLT